jgi:hypothetical protein
LALWSVKLKFQEPLGSQMLNVVRLLNVVICSGPVVVSKAGGAGFTLIVMLSVAVQLLSSVTVSVYTVVTVGDALGLATLGLLNPVAGDQL